MQKRFYLIRHGDKEKVVGDPSLTQLGQEQAETTGKYLQTLKKSFSVILTSPLRRTQQTAELIAAAISVPIKLEPLLRERVNWGDDPRQPLEEFMDMWLTATKDRDWQPPVGDSSRGAGRRLETEITSLADDSDDKPNAIFVTHGGIIADFLMNVFDETALDDALPGFAVRKEDMIRECSITVVEYDPATRNYELLQLAKVDHLVNKGL